MLTNPWMSLWAYLGIFVAAAVLGLAMFGTSKMRRRDPISAKTDQAFQRDREQDEP